VSSLGTLGGPRFKSGVALRNDGDVEAVDIGVMAEFVDCMVGRGRAESAPT
jgi:hypothetical protein